MYKNRPRKTKFSVFRNIEIIMQNIWILNLIMEHMLGRHDTTYKKMGKKINVVAMIIILALGSS
jgi:hypothetical protein